MLHDRYFIVAGSFWSIQNHSTIDSGSHVFRYTAGSSSSVLHDHHRLLLQDRDVAAGSVLVVRGSQLHHYATDYSVMPQHHFVMLQDHSVMPRDHFVMLHNHSVVL